MSGVLHVIRGWSQIDIPEGVPGSWEVWNANEPFSAHVTWEGHYMVGKYYGAIDPDDTLSDSYRRRAQERGAHRLVFHSRAGAEAWGRAWCAKHAQYFAYDDIEFRVTARAFLRHKRKGW